MPVQELKRISEAIAAGIYKDYGVQYRTALYLIPLNKLPGQPTPIRLPEDDGTAVRVKGYPELPLIPKGSAVPTNLVGFYLLKNRRSVAGTLQSLESVGLAVGHAGTRHGGGKVWVPTKKGRELHKRLLLTFNDEGRAFDGYDIRGFDAEGFDRDGVSFTGRNRAGELVGIHHLFARYYGVRHYL